MGVGDLVLDVGAGELAAGEADELEGEGDADRLRALAHRRRERPDLLHPLRRRDRRRLDDRLENRVFAQAARGGPGHLLIAPGELAIGQLLARVDGADLHGEKDLLPPALLLDQGPLGVPKRPGSLSQLLSKVDISNWRRVWYWSRKYCSMFISVASASSPPGVIR